MSEPTLRINTMLGDDGFKELEKTAEKSFGEVKKEVADFNRNTKVELNVKTLDKQIKQLDESIAKAARKRQVLLEMPQMPEVERKVAKFDKALENLTKKRELKLDLKQKEIDRANDSLRNLTAAIGLASAAIVVANGVFAKLAGTIANSLDHIDKASQKLGLSIKTYQELDYIASQTGTSIDGLGRSMRTLSIQAVANNSTFKALGINVKDANGNLKNQEQLLYEVIGALQKYPEGVERAKAANELLGMSAAELAPLLNAGTGSLEELAEKAREYGLILSDDVVKAGADAVSAFDTMRRSASALLKNAIAPILPAFTNFAYAAAKLMADLQPLAQKIVPMLVSGLQALLPVIAGVAAGLATYAAAWAVVTLAKKAATVATTAFTLATKGLTAAMKANPVGLLAVAVGALVTGLIYAVKNWKLLVAQISVSSKKIFNVVATIFENINIAVKQSVTNIKNKLFDLLKFIADEILGKISGLLSAFSGIPGLGKLFESAKKQVDGFNQSIQESLTKSQQAGQRELAEMRANALIMRTIRQKNIENAQAELDALKALKDEAQKDQEQRNADLLNLDSGGNSVGAKAEQDRLKALEERYAAQVKIAKATIRDEEELRQALLDIDKAYFAEKQRLVQESLEKQIMAGRELNAAQIALLQELQQKNKELNAQDDALAELEKVYKARMEIARRTISDEDALETELINLKRQYLKERLNLLLKEAETAIKIRGEIGDNEIAEIKRVKDAIEALDAASSFAAKLKKMAQEFADYIGGMISSFTDFMSAMYDRRIEALDQKHEQELRMIDNRLAAELAMYEAQLEEFEDLDERREELAAEHAERMEELNWKQQEHVTEDQYRALQEQQQEEEARYAASLAVLEEDAARRDEIRLQQEQAEEEALKLKEQKEKEYAIRRAEMERKQAIADKANALFSAVVNVAQGISKAWAQGGALLGPVFAALVAAAGAIQIAAISARPLPAIPSFFKGGEVKGPNKDQYRCFPAPDNPYDNVLMWAQEGEQVLPLTEAKAYRRLKALGLTLADILTAPPQLALPGGGGISTVSGSNNNTVVNSHMHITPREGLTFGEARRLGEKQARAIARKLG